MTTDQPSDLLSLTHRYLQAIEQNDQATLETLLDEGITQQEFPNRLVPTGATRDRAAILEGFHRGQSVLTAQRYTIKNAITQGDTIALEVTWTGALAIPIGALVPGDTMRANFALFIQFRDGKIIAQRNYDCFDPF